MYKVDIDLKNENNSIYFNREDNDNVIEENIINYLKIFNPDEIIKIEKEKSVNNSKLDKNFEKIQ